ncbi:outer membrane lipoprotein-sorting protein [Microbulbifer variabilis]|uniref:Outer membrane lipoprotein-sorting protein n=1 Tax=Microbulbifer variabilis TaxID=266805 RepID=A0ABY4VDX8_9GAMM|nr:outer membrane lipoprotein-sorting protein [Microbulbifer variabilis]USD22424.1 outer membrane lipoprotein-sorting protein [Microbulbifer variabilis]
MIKNGILTCLLLLLASLAMANTEMGLEIAKERKVRDEGWRDSIATVSMLLKNALGETSSRELRVRTLEIEGDGDRGLTVFDEPRDVKGTAFLSYSHINSPDDQWLYLPRLKRVKRIASRNKSGPFMSSEFAYEDMTSFELKKYKFSYLREELIKGRETLVVEQIPTDEYSGYTRQVVWIDKDHYQPIRTEFYDRKGELLKTLHLEDYRQYLEQYWRAHVLTMINHQTGKSTVLTVHDLKFKVGLGEDDFNVATLKRIR